MIELLLECPDCKTVMVSDYEIGETQTCCVCYVEFKVEENNILDKQVFD